MNLVVLKLREYSAETLKISRHSRRNVLVVLYKVLLARLYYGLGIEDFKLYRLMDKPVSKYNTYMFQNQIEPLQQVLNGEDLENICRDKLRYYSECQKHKLPTPQIIACLGDVEGEKYSAGIPVISSGEDLTRLVGEINDYFIFKPVGSACGSGIVRFRVDQGILFDDTGAELQSEDLVADLLAQESGLHILQPALRPHGELSPIMPGITLGTFRMIISNRKRNAEVDYACVKIPVSEAVADNFHGGSSGNFVSDIEIETGKLGQTLGASEDYPGLIELKFTHPVSKSTIPGFAIPYWSEMLALVKDATEKLGLMTAGWDVALTEGGPCLIEVNGRYDVGLLQATMGRGLKAEFSGKLQCGPTTNIPDI